MTIASIPASNALGCLTKQGYISFIEGRRISRRCISLLALQGNLKFHSQGCLTVLLRPAGADRK
jgi:hypothetical protein